MGACTPGSAKYSKAVQTVGATLPFLSTLGYLGVLWSTRASDPGVQCHLDDVEHDSDNMENHLDDTEHPPG